MNDVGFENQSNENGEIITCKERVKQLNELHLKYVDDLTLAESISMKTQLSEVPVHARQQPDTYHERTGHILNPNQSRVFQNLLETERYATENGMRINYRKTKLMVFNPGKIRDFFPRLIFNKMELEVVEEIKLLGVIITKDLSWGPNTDYIVKKANRKLWYLRRLKSLGARTSDLLEIYSKLVRSQLELAVAAWHPGLNGVDRLKIERVQKSACCIILGQEYESYRRALKKLNLETLFERRNKLCIAFSKKAQKHPKFSKWFKPNIKKSCTRTVPKRFCEVVARTERFKHSPISYLTNILNRQ